MLKCFGLIYFNERYILDEYFVFNFNFVEIINFFLNCVKILGKKKRKKVDVLGIMRFIFLCFFVE